MKLISECCLITSCLAWVFTILVLSEKFFKLSNLILILFKKRVFRVLIDRRFIRNLLGAARISQRGKRLVKVVISRGQGSYHDCFRVSTEGILKKARQL